MRAAARVARLERRRQAGQSDDEIQITAVVWPDESEQPGLSLMSERRRRVDYRAGLHLIAPEGWPDCGVGPGGEQPPAGPVVVLSWGDE